MSRPLTPWAAYDRVSSTTEPPEDGIERELFLLLAGQPASDESLRALVETAFDLFQGEGRHALNALILCDANAKDVEDALELGPGVYATYGVLFFDRGYFRNVFDIRSFVRNLPKDDPEVLEVYRLATIEGAPRLLDRYRVKEAPAPSPDRVLGDMLKETHSRSFEHRGRTITSRAAQESFKWGRAAAQTALSVKQSTTSDQVGGALAALKLALTTDDTTKRPTDLGLNKDDIITG